MFNHFNKKPRLQISISLLETISEFSLQLLNCQLICFFLIESFQLLIELAENGIQILLFLPLLISHSVIRVPGLKVIAHPICRALINWLRNSTNLMIQRERLTHLIVWFYNFQTGKIGRIVFFVQFLRAWVIEFGRVLISLSMTGCSVGPYFRQK